MDVIAPNKGDPLRFCGQFMAAFFGSRRLKKLYQPAEVNDR
ncbi:hypothetical protein [Hydrogenophaga sp. SL48]|jgi:hypothetical protein|nr:hypothetical protein [Hydrogenophaga sp. SL48]